ncbi:hypothetical protein V8E55_005248 [Tylopilus felleus]
MSKPQLDRVDQSVNSRNTLEALVKLLAPHAPYSLHVLGTILNSGPRTTTLQSVDSSKVSLWSTVPLLSDATSNTSSPALFSIIAFSHLNRQFSVFCSGESTMPTDAQTQAEKAHIKQVFENLRDMARGAHPTYDSNITALSAGTSVRLAHRTDTDPPMIVVAAVHKKWAEVLAPMSTCQNLTVRYVFPRGAFTQDGLQTTFKLCGGDVPAGIEASEEDSEEVEATEIRASDLPFVHGASSIPRPDAYLLSRAPYSVCFRLGRDARMGGDEGRPVACALMHSDGSLGALRVDPKHQRRGLGRLVIRALMEKLDFSEGQGNPGSSSNDHRDLGGGALGWNWTDAEIHNEVANRFFTSMVGEENRCAYHWTYITIDGCKSGKS